MPSRLRIALASILAVAALGAVAPAANAYVYWANFGSGSIGRANLDGTNAQQSFISGLSQVVDVAVDSNYIYWNDQGTSIARANLDGTGVNRSFVGSARSPTNVAVYGSYIYYVNDGGDSIGRVNVNGTGQDNGFINGLTAASDKAYAVEVDSTGIYATSFNNQRILRWNLDGTNRTFLFSTPLTEPTGIALRNPYLYTANFYSDSIGRGEWTGTGWEKNFVSGVSFSDPNGIAVDSTSIFWTNTSTNTIGRSNLDGSSPNGSFITGASDPSGMAVDALSPAGSLTPSTYDYGAVKAQGGEKLSTFTLTSTGNVPLTIQGASVVGDGDGNYGVLGGESTCLAGGVTLANGQSCTVLVNFAPSSLGAKTATLNVDTNAGLKTVSLSGTGVDAPSLIPVRTSKTSSKFKVGCADSNPCSLRLTGKKVGTNAQITPKTVAVGAGQQPVVTLAYSPALKRAFAKGGRLSVTATRLNATGVAKTITVTVRR